MSLDIKDAHKILNDKYDSIVSKINILSNSAMSKSSEDYIGRMKSLEEDKRRYESFIAKINKSMKKHNIVV